MNGGYYSGNFRRFTRQWWARAGRDALWITIVSVLVWVFADMKFIDEDRAKIELHLVAGDGSNMSLLSATGEEISFHPMSVTFTIKGSRESLDIFEREVPEFVQYNIGRREEAGELKIPTVDILSDLPIISENNLLVSAPKPSVIVVQLDEQIRRELPVELVYSNAELAKTPTQTVAVRLAQSKWNLIELRDPNPKLRTANKDLASAETGKPIEVEFDIRPEIGQTPVQLETKTIKVKLQITQRVQSKPLTVNVRCIAPAGWSWDGTWEKFQLLGKAESLEWRKEITVKGSKKDLDRLEAKDIDAYIKLTEDDKAPVSWLRRPLIVRFPNELSVELVGDPPTVSFKLIERAEHQTPALQ